MTTSSWFEIECVDGAAATIYLSDVVDLEHFPAIREAVDALPPTIQVLRLQIATPPSGGQLPSATRALVRHWRQSRESAICIVHYTDGTITPAGRTRNRSDLRSAFAAAEAAAETLGRAAAWAARTAAFL